MPYYQTGDETPCTWQGVRVTGRVMYEPQDSDMLQLRVRDLPVSMFDSSPLTIRSQGYCGDQQGIIYTRGGSRQACHQRVWVEKIPEKLASA